MSKERVFLSSCYRPSIVTPPNLLHYTYFTGRPTCLRHLSSTIRRFIHIDMNRQTLRIFIIKILRNQSPEEMWEFLITSDVFRKHTSNLNNYKRHNLWFWLYKKFLNKCLIKKVIDTIWVIFNCICYKNTFYLYTNLCFITLLIVKKCKGFR